MNEIMIDGKRYKLPNSLNPFQQEIYLHLIEWKWQHITMEPGIDRGLQFDAILPDSFAGKFPTLYPQIIGEFVQHLQEFPFRVHKYFNHMASSQAANINLFFPILLHPNTHAILGVIKPDLARIAYEHLDHGYRVEFWDEPYGNLNDKSPVSGTDTDLAIAYYNHEGKLCLWLIEHKLTEPEFTACGGYKSRGRQVQHDCSKNFAQLIVDKDSCYYHDVRRFNYWRISEANQAFFANHHKWDRCPFQGGLNQLWRNQLLALSIEQDERQPYQQGDFSVVTHPRNSSLDKSIAEYRDLIACNPKFSVFTSAEVIKAAARYADTALEQWIAWYTELYQL